MSAKVIWYEGAFIRPQHFQQQERYLLHQLDSRTRVQFPYGYGFSHLSLGLQSLEFGQIELSQCAGVFQDGTTFNAPEFDDLPNTIKVADGTKDALVYLAIPAKQLTAAEIGEQDEDLDRSHVARFRSKNKKVVDVSDNQGTEADLKLGQLHLRLFIENHKAQERDNRVPEGYLKLPVARIVEVRSGRIKIDEQFIATILHYSQSKVLTDFIAQMHGIFSARADSIAARVSGRDFKRGVADTTDLMLLQMLNRYEPQFAHFESLEGLHPLFLYQLLLGFSGELSTFMKQSKRPIKYPLYDHDLPGDCFKFIMQDIKQSFSVVQDERVLSIPISAPNQYGIRAARINTPDILDTSLFVLAVRAEVSEEMIRQEFPSQIKVAPGERIHRLINSNLPGVEIKPMPVAPREIPYITGFTYFEINNRHSMWRELKQSAGLAFHVAGNFPGLEMQLWAIKRL